jgi:hypothetical protein
VGKLWGRLTGQIPSETGADRSEAFGESGDAPANRGAGRESCRVRDRRHAPPVRGSAGVVGHGLS